MLAAKKGESTSLYQYSNVIYIVSAVIVVCLLSACNANDINTASTEAEPIFAPEHIEQSCIEKCPDQVSADRCYSVQREQTKQERKNWQKRWQFECVLCVRKKLFINMRAKDDDIVGRFFFGHSEYAQHIMAKILNITTSWWPLKNSSNNNNNNHDDNNKSSDTQSNWINMLTIFCFGSRSHSCMCFLVHFTQANIWITCFVSVFICLPFEI